LSLSLSHVPHSNAREGMRRMLLLMDLGRFNSAFDHADLSIRLLRTFAPLHCLHTAPRRVN
jgi:hypothetical protein